MKVRRSLPDVAYNVGQAAGKEPGPLPAHAIAGLREVLGRILNVIGEPGDADRVSAGRDRHGIDPGALLRGLITEGYGEMQSCFR